MTETAVAVALPLAGADHGRPSHRATRPGSPWGFRPGGRCPGRWRRRGERVERLLQRRPTHKMPDLWRRGLRRRRWRRHPEDRFKLRSAPGAKLQNALGSGVPVGFAHGDLDRSEAGTNLLRQRHAFVKSDASALGQLGLGMYRKVERLQKPVPEIPGIAHPHALAPQTNQPLIESAFAFVLALLRVTEGHSGGLQGALERIKSQQINDLVQEAATDGAAVWSIRFLNKIFCSTTIRGAASRRGK